jgi:hypothetical protein
MKEQAINMITTLDGFLSNIKNIATHPYGNGINIDKMLTDLQSFVNELRDCIEKIEEAADKPAKEENSK